MSIFTTIQQRSLEGTPCGVGFMRQTSRNTALIKRLCLTKRLEKHSGCVNTIQWNKQGDLLVSGSDDTRLCIWRYPENKLVHCIETGHMANIFCAKFATDNLVVCCAGDHQIRAFDVEHAAGTKGPSPFRVYTDHDGRVKKLTFRRPSPFVFFSCSEDGTIRRFDLREPSNMHDEEENIIVDMREPKLTEIYSLGLQDNLLACAGGSPFVFLYDLRMNQLVKRFAPPHIVRSVDVAMHNLSVHGHITGIAFSNNQILANYSYDNVYLFDINKSIDYDNDAAEAYMAKRTEQQSSASSDMDVDTGRDTETKSATSDVPEPEIQCEFYERRYAGHINIRTVKEVNFFGPNNEYVVSGSDDGNIFIWDKETTEIVNVMQGDSMIVNCLSGHPFDSCVLATSGIDNDVKLWQPGDPTTSPINIDELVKHNTELVKDSLSRVRCVPMSLLRYIHLLARMPDSDDSDDEGSMPACVQQ